MLLELYSINFLLGCRVQWVQLHLESVLMLIRLHTGTNLPFLSFPNSARIVLSRWSERFYYQGCRVFGCSSLLATYSKCFFDTETFSNKERAGNHWRPRWAPASREASSHITQTFWYSTYCWQTWQLRRKLFSVWTGNRNHIYVSWTGFRGRGY